VVRRRLVRLGIAWEVRVKSVFFGEMHIFSVARGRNGELHIGG
jgi:hypothetical protein